MTADIQAAIDRQPICRQHLVLLALCTLVMMIDGFDIYMIGHIAPTIAEDMAEPASGLTKIFLFQQIGLAVGGFVIGPVADRYGRKPMLCLSTIAFGSLTLAALAATSLLELAILRGLAGLFLAGVVPNALALLTEATPARYRSTFVAIAFAGFVIGSGVSSVIVLFFLADYGWQSCFLIGGVVPLLFVPLCLFFMDESVPFMLRRNASDRRIAASLRKLAPDFDLPAVQDRTSPADVQEIGLQKGGLGRIFEQRWLALTLILWASYFLSVGSVSMMASWSTTFFNELADVSVQSYAAINLFHVAGSLIGTVMSGFLLDRFAAGRVVLTLMLAAAVSIALVGSVPFGGPASMLVFFWWGVCQIGGQAALNVMCSQLYPTAIRTTGVGWAFAMGRVGSIVGPLLGGAALAAALTLQQIYLAAAVVQLAVMTFMLALAKRFARNEVAMPPMVPEKV